MLSAVDEDASLEGGKLALQVADGPGGTDLLLALWLDDGQVLGTDRAVVAQPMEGAQAAVRPDLTIAEEDLISSSARDPGTMIHAHVADVDKEDAVPQRAHGGDDVIAGHVDAAKAEEDAVL